MIFLSAGHNLQGPNPDPGACSGTWVEAELTKELRDLVEEELQVLLASITTDKDSETLAQYIRRIKPGTGSVVCEFHFNCSDHLATGVEVLVKDAASVIERKLANDICDIVKATGLLKRGVKTEAQSHRGHLGILHTRAGMSVLLEICFINNPRDMDLYQKNKGILAMQIAAVLYKYDKLYN